MSSKAKVWLPGCILLLAALLVGCGNSPTSPRPPAGTITVFAHEGDRVVPGVHAEILDSGLAGQTGADGKVQFTVSPGIYIVRVHTNGQPLPPYLDNKVTVADHDALVVECDWCWSCR